MDTPVKSSLHRNWIGGEWIESTQASPNVNPSDTTDVIGEYAQANDAQARAAIAAVSGAGGVGPASAGRHEAATAGRASASVDGLRETAGKSLVADR